ncbi:MAG: FAD-dependent oxidoreductase [Alphaproteobacteria bacterium]|nr:FAD-dependent oxidoreductase [Alphaproteobacteria bacterium]
MPRAPLKELDGRKFDVAVIGAGAIGSSAAQHLAAAGHAVLLVDKGDFGAGTSSRSGRLLACGIRYLEPGDGLAYMAPGASPLWQFARHPGQFLKGVRKARECAASRSHIARTMPERVEANTWFYPIYDTDKYAPWQVSLGFRMLWALGPKDVPLDYRSLSPAEAKTMPLISGIRDFDRLKAVASFREYRFEWPERIVVDNVLDAECMGAVVRNHTPVRGLHRQGDVWSIELADAAEPGQTARVDAKAVVNAAGIWIDGVNRLAAPKATRRITGTKGSHVMVQLPPECRTLGIITSYGDGNPLYIYPWRGMHYIGPTDTLFDGDVNDEIVATEDEVAFLLSEANHLLPGVNLKRKDVLFTWAGVRPQTYDPEIPMGRRWRHMHDMTEDGMPNVFALTAGNIITHRFAGAELSQAVSARVTPSGAPREISYATKLKPDGGPRLLNHWDGATLGQLRHAAAHEHPVSLTDLLFRRVGAGWTATMAREAAGRAAEEVAPIMGWDKARVEREVADYHAHIARLHGVTADR